MAGVRAVGLLLLTLGMFLGGCGSSGESASCSRHGDGVPLVRHGPPAQGEIHFGATLLERGGLRREKSTFAAEDDLAWYARFRRPVPVSSTVQLVISKVNCGGLSRIYSGGEEVDKYVKPVLGMAGSGTFRVVKMAGLHSVVEFGEVVNPMRRLAYGLTDTGTYVMQYRRDGITLAEGRFSING